MLSDTYALSPDLATAVATNAVTFTKNYADKGASEYSVTGIAAPEEKVLLVNHSLTNAGVWRSKFEIRRTITDALLVPQTARLYIVQERPQSTVITDTVLKEMKNQLVHASIISSGALWDLFLARNN